MKFTSLTDEARIALGGMADYAGGLVNPTVRLGVTGLSRSGKTVFITALVHNLIHGGRLPLFTPYAEGRIKKHELTTIEKEEDRTNLCDVQGANAGPVFLAFQGAEHI